MALLSFRGIDTPSLQAQGEQRLPPIFNIQRDNAGGFVGIRSPKHLPYDEVKEVLQHPTIWADVIINVSALALRRVSRLKEKGLNVDDWIDKFSQAFVDAMGTNPEAWIRKPIPGDSQEWTIICYWAPPIPKHDWIKAGFVKIGSDEGKYAVDYFSKFKKAS